MGVIPMPPVLVAISGVTAQRILSGWRRVEDQVDVRARFPGRKRMAADIAQREREDAVSDLALGGHLRLRDELRGGQRDARRPVTDLLDVGGVPVADFS
jgi:hypothetical protein